MITKDQKSEIRQALINYTKQGAESYKMSQNQVANKLGINAAYVSAIVNGKENVDKSEISDRYYILLAELLEIELEKKYWEVFRTKQMLAALAALEDAREFGRTITIVGETGCGKSLACDIFEKKYPTECFKVIISNLDTINDIIDKLMSKLNIKLETRSKSKKLQEITWVLISMRMRGGKPLIIFDEAEFMSHVTLCAIKSLYDHLNKIVGCVMIGTEQILRNYDRLKKTNKTGIPQLYRRIKFGIVNLPPIDKRYNEFLSEIKDKELVKWLRNNCENFGELHDVLEPAKREADRLKEPLSYELVMKINGFNW